MQQRGARMVLGRVVAYVVVVDFWSPSGVVFFNTAAFPDSRRLIRVDVPSSVSALFAYARGLIKIYSSLYC